jgi:hypothetical protein
MLFFLTIPPSHTHTHTNTHTHTIPVFISKKFHHDCMNSKIFLSIVASVLNFEQTYTQRYNLRCIYVVYCKLIIVFCIYTCILRARFCSLFSFKWFVLILLSKFVITRTEQGIKYKHVICLLLEVLL